MSFRNRSLRPHRPIIFRANRTGEGGGGSDAPANSRREPCTAEPPSANYIPLAFATTSPSSFSPERQDAVRSGTAAKLRRSGLGFYLSRSQQHGDKPRRAADVPNTARHEMQSPVINTVTNFVGAFVAFVPGMPNSSNLRAHDGTATNGRA